MVNINTAAAAVRPDPDQGILNDIFLWYLNSGINRFRTSYVNAPLWLCFFSASDVTSVHNALVYAQAVQITSDGIKTEKVGIDTQGELKGSISNGREDLPVLKMQFLETNVSFTDGYLRNWMGGFTAHGLKKGSIFSFQNRQVSWQVPVGSRGSDTLTIYQFGKGGAPGEKFEIRQKTVYKNVRPVNIDSQELNYEGDAVVRRSVDFIFDNYTIDFPLNRDNKDWFDFEKHLHSAKMNASDSDRLRDDQTDYRDTQETILERTRSTVENQVEQSINQITAAGAQIQSNLENVPGELARRATKQVTQPVQEVVQDATWGAKGIIQDAKDDLMGMIGGQPQGYIKVPQDDTPEAFIKQYKTVDNGVPAEFRHQRVEIPEDDVPEMADKRQTDSGLLGDLSSGRREDSAKQISKDASDTPLFFGPYDYGYDLKIPQDDTPQYPSVMIDDVRVPDRSASGKKTSKQFIKPSQQNNNPGKISDKQPVNVPDRSATGEKSPTQLINIPSNDTPKGESIPVQFVPIPK